MRNVGFLIESHAVLTSLSKSYLEAFSEAWHNIIYQCVFPVLEQWNQTISSDSGDMFLTWQASKMMVGKFTSFAQKPRDIKPLKKKIRNKIAVFPFLYLVGNFCHSTNKPKKKKKIVEKWKSPGPTVYEINSACFFSSHAMAFYQPTNQPKNPSPWIPYSISFKDSKAQASAILLMVLPVAFWSKRYIVLLKICVKCTKKHLFRRKHIYVVKAKKHHLKPLGLEFHASRDRYTYKWFLSTNLDSQEWKGGELDSHLLVHRTATLCQEWSL